MKLFRLLFFLCLPFNWLFSQNTENNIKLLVPKDSISFYSFNKESVTEYTILESKKLSKTSLRYTGSFPEELKNADLRSLTYVFSKDGGVYFLYPGGGILFKYFNGVFKRCF